MATITPSVRAFLQTGPLGHIVTLGAGGQPHVSLAWVGLDGDDLVWATFSDQHKIENLRRDPRITISFQAKEDDGGFLFPYLVVEGTATLSDGGALEIMDRYAPIYTGQDQFPLRDMPAGITVRVAVDRVYGQGSWKQAAEATG